MTKLPRLMLATAFLGTATFAQADDSTFAGLSLGNLNSKYNKSGTLDRNLDNPQFSDLLKKGNFSARIGQQNDQGRYYATYEYNSGSHGDLRLRQQSLLGSYDLFYPVASNTKLFAGATAGVTQLSQYSSGLGHDTGNGYAIGAQAGILQQVSKNVSVEAGYRYLRTNAKVDFGKSGDKQGSLQLDSTAQAYLGASYHF